MKAANALWMHDTGAEWNIREKFYEGYKEIRELGDNFGQNEKFNKIQTLSWMVAGLIEMVELTDYQKEIYGEKLSRI